MQTWPEHLLQLINGTFNIVGVFAAALVILSLVLVYFTGNELNRRTSRHPQPTTSTNPVASRVAL